MKPIYEVSYVDSTLKIYEECISFTPKGFFGFMSKGMAGERKIFYKNITQIQFKEPTKWLSGFIEFYVLGQYDSNQGGGIWTGTTNENRLNFDLKMLPIMIQIRDFVSSKLKTQASFCDNLQNEDIVAELRKYKQLLDEGVITQEEYNAKKKQILGL